MNRRSFITSMLAAAVAPMALKGAGRTWVRASESWIWTPTPTPPLDFIKLLESQLPLYVEAMFRDFRPTDGLILTRV